MFRQYDNIKINETSITFIMVESLQEFIIEFANSNPIEWMSEDHQTWYGTRGEACFLGGRWLIIRIKSGQEFKVYMHPEIRYVINKSILKSGEFDLNYRKHIRGKFSRKHMDIFFVDKIDEEMSEDVEFQRAVIEVKTKAEEFSFGIESKPTVIISPSWDTDEHFMSFLIIKEGKIVGQGVY